MNERFYPQMEDGTLDLTQLRVFFHEKPINRMTPSLARRLSILYEKQLGLSLDEILKELLESKLAHAWYESYQYIDGGDWYLPPYILMIENEVGGWTLMLEDE